MQELEYACSTSAFVAIDNGIVAKRPMTVWRGNPRYKTLEKEYAEAIERERQLFEYLGSHESIVPYYGPYEESGIQLAKASHGNLQDFIDRSNDHISLELRWKWILQATNAIVFLHGKGVMHSDLRLENYLVHSTPMDLWLCDLGGSTCEELGLDGNHLPDDPFSDPRIPQESTPATDIFSLGSIFYSILTGFWPHRNGPAPTNLERYAFQDQVRKQFKAGHFPDVSNLTGGEVVKGCWDHKYGTAQEVLDQVKLKMTELGFLVEGSFSPS